MLIDGTSMFMTQRTFPQLCLFKLSREGDHFLIRHGDHTMQLPFEYQGPGFHAQVWNDIVQVHEVSARHSEWFSDLLGMNCRLVSFPEDYPRPVDPAYRVNNEHVSLADSHPLLLIGQSSLDDLNGRLMVPLPMNRFRPNIVVSGGEPYEEDGWKYFSIGDCRFARMKACSRCVTTTIDQDSAEKGTEPLATLATYRRVDNKVYFGQDVVTLNCGEIAVGDEVVLE
jgi:uncharacterized protein YcbX